MAKFVAEFSVDNSAFRDEDGNLKPWGQLLNTVLDISLAVQAGETEGTLMDINGNRIGRFGIVNAKLSKFAQRR